MTTDAIITTHRTGEYLPYTDVQMALAAAEVVVMAEAEDGDMVEAVVEEGDEVAEATPNTSLRTSGINYQDGKG